jgi:hypothetical protein
VSVLMALDGAGHYGGSIKMRSNTDTRMHGS